MQEYEWLTKFGSWICGVCKISEGQTTIGNGGTEFFYHWRKYKLNLKEIEDF